MSRLRVALLSSAPPRLAWRLAERIEQEVPEARICGLLYRPPRRKREPVRAAARWLAEAGLRWMHACPRAGGHGAFSVADLVGRCREAGWPILVTDDVHSRAAEAFLRQQDADHAVVGPGGAFPASLLRLPRHGSLAAQRRTLRPPGSASSGGRSLAGADAEPVVERVCVEWYAQHSAVLCSRPIAREPFDTPVSLGLKADLVTHDLLVAALARLCADGGDDAAAVEPPLAEAAALPLPSREASPPPRRPVRTAPPLWKMGLCAAVLSPFWIARNWHRRLRRRHPVTVLFHHLAADRPHHLAMPTDTFFETVRFLQRHYRVLSLAEAMDALASGSVPAPSVVLTLDDGYGENFLTVRAVMEATGVPLTLFVNPELVEQRRPLPHDLKRGQDRFPVLTWDEVVHLAGSGAEIGSHTRTHFDCGSRDRETLEREIAGSKRDLERRLGRPVRAFAFPWGHPENMSSEAIGIARTAYAWLFGAHGGQCRPGHPAPDVWPRTFQCHDLWELELSLQSLFDVAHRLRGALKRLAARGGAGRPSAVAGAEIQGEGTHA